MSNLETFKTLVKIGVAIIVVIAIGFVTFRAYDFYTLSKLPKIPFKNLGTTEEKQLRVGPPKVRYIGGGAIPRSKAVVYVANNSYVALDKVKASTLAKEFGFGGKPSLHGELIIWNSKGKNFVVDIQNRNVSFAVDATKEPLVSSDIIGNTYGAIADLSFTKVVGGNLVKVLSWYDNEVGYANTLVKHIILSGKYIK